LISLYTPGYLSLDPAIIKWRVFIREGSASSKCREDLILTTLGYNLWTKVARILLLYLQCN
jgi:hypothetical protein